MENLCPVSNILLKIDKALQDEIITESGLKFYIAPDYNKEWQATVTATIAALPLKISKQDKLVCDKLKVGDEVAISYQVVADLTFGSDSARFMEATSGSDKFREFRNGMGEWLRVYALPKKRGFREIPMWVGVREDKFGRFIDGSQGSQSDVERWMAQFPFGKTDDYTFNNLFVFNGGAYWKCRPQDIFARKVNGRLVSVGNRVICYPIEQKVPKSIADEIKYGSEVKVRFMDRGRVLSGGESRGLKKSSTIAFDSNHCERYTFWGKNYYLIHENMVTGKWQTISS